MKKSIIGGLVVLFVVLASAYVYFSGKEYTVKISESDIQQQLAEKMPISESYLVFLRATLDNPRVKLEKGSNRVNAGLDIVLSLKLADVEKPFGGSLDVSGGIRYEVKDKSFYLTDPKIENLSVQGFPDKYLSQATVLIEKFLAKHYQTHPIYTLKSTDAKQKALQLVLKDVIVEDKYLVITMGI